MVDTSGPTITIHIAELFSRAESVEMFAETIRETLCRASWPGLPDPPGLDHGADDGGGSEDDRGADTDHQ